MPTRNINLTERYDEFLTSQIESGRYKNASEAVRAALYLLEKQDREDTLKLEALREAAQSGLDAYNNGEYTTISSDAELNQFFAEIAKRTDRR